MDKQILNTVTIYALDIIGIIPSKTIIGSKKIMAIIVHFATLASHP